MGPDSRRASVPPGWTRTKLGDVASVRSSNVDKKKRPSEVSVRLCNYMDVYSNDIVHDQLDFMVASATKTEISRFGLVGGDVVITKDSETPDDIAVPAVVRGPLSAPLVCGYHLAILRASHKRVSGEFLAFALRSSEANAPFRKAANGSTRYGLSLDAIESAPLTLPPPPEQRRIAEILDTLDAAIRRTEQVIAKLQQMKQGLLHDLLTRGIDEHGELRDPERHPEQFKDSPLGQIPSGWEVRRIREVCKMGRGRVISLGYLLAHPGPFPVYSSQSKNDGIFGMIGTFDFKGEYVTWTTDGAYAGTVSSGRASSTAPTSAGR